MARVVAVIPARAGSKGIPGKNHRPMAGQPLVAWAIDAALATPSVDLVVVSTDDPQVAHIAAGRGAVVHRRSAASATDSAPTESVLAEVADAFPAQVYVLLQATSPLTAPDDIEAALKKIDEGYDSVLSVVPQHRFIWTEPAEGGSAVPANYEPAHRPRRQDAAPILVENGAVYAYRRDVLVEGGSRIGGRVGLIEMAEDTYWEVDEPRDWPLIERALQARRRVAAVPADIRLVLADVDGVLTDAGMYWNSDGSESKRFNARDGKGFQLLGESGIATALITSEALELVQRRGAKLGCAAVVLASSDKLADADRLRRDMGLQWDQIAFIGDDVHDLELLRRVGLSAAPADCAPSVTEAVDLVLSTAGGHGCFREFADLILLTSGGRDG